MTRRQTVSRRRTARLLTAGFVAAATALAGCGSSGPGDAGGENAIEVWALQDNVLNEIEQGSLDRFNESGDGEASLQTFGNDPYKQKLRVALGSPNAPDVFFNWGGGNLKEFVDAGKIRDLTPALEENPEVKDAFVPSVLDAAKFDGKYYGLPMRGVQPVVLYYNKAVFADAGVEPPETYEDLLSLVDTFKAEGVTPIALAGSQAWTELMWAEYLLDRIAGPEVFQAIRDGDTSAWKDPAVVEALTRVRELVEAGAFGDDFASVGYDNGAVSTLLAQGDAAMHLMGSWGYVDQKGQNPEFVENGDLGYVPFPAVQDGEGDPANIVGNPTNFYSVSSDSNAPQVAEDYVTTALHDEKYVNDLVEAGDVPAVTGVRDQLESADNAEYATWVYDLVNDAPSFQLSWDQDLPPDQATQMLTQLQQVFLGEQTPQGFADTMSQG